MTDGAEYMRAVRPALGVLKDYLGKDCTSCHQVPEGDGAGRTVSMKVVARQGQ